MLNILSNTPQEKKKLFARYFFIIFITFLFLFQGKFFNTFSNKTITGWDTQAQAFIYFLYFSDSLKNGVIPLWNPLIQAGTFFPTFWLTGLFYPFDLFFVFISWIVGPLMAMELLIQASLAVGSIGCFLLFRYWKIDLYISFIGALFFSVVILSPLVGQIWYVKSFSSLPWLILISSILSSKENQIATTKWMAWGLFYVFFIAGGYLWLNIINLLIASSIIFIKLTQNIWLTRKSTGFRLLRSVLSTKSVLFLCFIGLMYGFIVMPCFLYIQFNTSTFLGDFISPDGRLRGLNNAGVSIGHGDIVQTLLGNIDPLISQNQIWWLDIAFSYGAGWSLTILFVTLIYLSWNTRQIYWALLMVFAIIYSAGGNTFLSSIINKIPVINGNRYWFGAGTIFAATSLLFIVVEKLNVLKSTPVTPYFLLVRLIIAAALSVWLLNIMSSPSLEFWMVYLSAAFIGIFFIFQYKTIGKIALTLLLFLNVVYILNTPLRDVSNLLLDDSYSQKINDRNQNVTVTANQRHVGNSVEYDFGNIDWVFNKIPYSHGYYHTGHPIYWFLKNNRFLDQIITITQTARPENGTKRDSLKSDNEYAEKIAADVLKDPDSPTIAIERFRLINASSAFSYKINDLKMGPNSVQFNLTLSDPAHVILNMVYAPGWHLLIDGKPQEQYRANYIFQGIDINSPGEYQIKFYYRPTLEIILLCIPYITLLALIAFNLALRIKPKGPSITKTIPLI